VNVNHDCLTAGCTQTSKRQVVQEREETDETQTTLEHKLLEQYTLNTNGLHNAYLLDHVLPSSLREVFPIYPTPEDRHAAHAKAAAHLKQLIESRSMQLKAKRAAKALESGTTSTRAKKGKAKAQEASAEDSEIDKGGPAGDEQMGVDEEQDFQEAGPSTSNKRPRLTES
jgi:type IV secretory pathway VirB10-like protein